MVSIVSGGQIGKPILHTMNLVAGRQTFAEHEKKEHAYVRGCNATCQDTSPGIDCSGVLAMRVSAALSFGCQRCGNHQMVIRLKRGLQLVPSLTGQHNTHQFCLTMDAKLLVDLCDLVADRMRRYMQLRGNFRVSHALCKAVSDIHLCRRKQIE